MIQTRHTKVLSQPLFFFLAVLDFCLYNCSTYPTGQNYGFLNKEVRYAIEFAIARYPIVVIKLAIAEATKGE